MIQEDLNQINGTHVEALVTTAVPEGRTLDYKRDLPGSAPADITELLRDVTSFANAEGGDIIYGLDEQRDSTGKATGIPASITGLAGANLGQEVLRLRQTIDSLVDPKIIGVDLRAVTTNQGPVLILRVPRSESSPHMIVQGGRTNSRFYARTGSGKQPMDVDEIRTAFLASGDRETRMRGLVDRRIEAILLERTPVVLGAVGRLAVHLIPFSAMFPKASVDFSKLRGHAPQPMRCSGWDYRFNLDGYLSYGGNAAGVAGQSRSYVLSFRSGVIEAVTCDLVQDNRARGGGISCPGTSFQELLITSTRDYLATLKRLDQSPPVAVFASLLGVRGAHWAVSNRYVAPGNGPYPFDRDIIRLPEVVVRDLNETPEHFLRPIMDAIWQAVGWERCHQYDNAGNYVP